MGKIITAFILAFFFFSIFVLLPRQIKAATIKPDPIGDLDIGKSKMLTISSLIPNKKYYWQEQKLTSTIPGPGYSPFFADCYIANSSGVIEKEIGPFIYAGMYQLTISPASTSRCESNGTSVIGPEDFSVGGPTGKSCCDAPPFIKYDRSTDRCNNIIVNFLVTPTQPTQCAALRTFCEPDSLQCFTTQTVVAGKICKEPKPGSDFDPTKGIGTDKYAVCAKAGGLKCEGETKPAIKTAIGCIHTNPADLVQDVLKFALGIGGGLAFLMMLLGAFQMLTSAGNPETLQAGKDRLTSAIIGLLFIIFAVLLLQIIGVDILGIPGFER